MLTTCTRNTLPLTETHLLAHRHTHTHSGMHKSRQTYIHTLTHTHRGTQMCTCVCLYIHTGRHMSMLVHKHPQMCMFTHIHTLPLPLYLQKGRKRAQLFLWHFSAGDTENGVPPSEKLSTVGFSNSQAHLFFLFCAAAIFAAGLLHGSGCLALQLSLNNTL